MSMAAVSEYIEKRDYEGLVELIMLPEFSRSDRVYVSKYLKRINSFDGLRDIAKIKLNIGSGDFSILQQQEIDIKIRYSLYNCLFSICSTEDILKHVPQHFANDCDFMSALIVSEKIIDHAMIDWIWDGALLGQIIETGQDLSSHELGKTSAFIFFRYFIYKSVYFLRKFYDACKGSGSKIAYFKNTLKQYFYENNKCTEDVICFLSRYCNLNDIFSDRYLKFYFENSCLTNNPGVVSAILKSGFNQITSGFNVAVRSNNLDLVKIILPYKPRLDTASKMQGCSQEIKDVLDLALQSKGKKKSKKNVS